MWPGLLFPEGSRTFTGAWIETRVVSDGYSSGGVAPSRVRGLKLLSIASIYLVVGVAPSRVRGLKHYELQHIAASAAGRTFTGAWIETGQSLTGRTITTRRTFTGAWIETGVNYRNDESLTVAPSRVRGLKPRTGYNDLLVFPSHLHGCVD